MSKQNNISTDLLEFQVFMLNDMKKNSDDKELIIKEYQNGEVKFDEYWRKLEDNKLEFDLLERLYNKSLEIQNV